LRIDAGIALAIEDGVSFGKSDPSRRMSGLAWLLVMAGAIALVDGFSLAVKEEARGSYGRVVNGIVTKRFSSDGIWPAWVVDYRFPCRTAHGWCSGRDLVSQDLWEKLRVGAPVRVRQGDREITTARLDDNPQLVKAFIKTAFGCALFALACAAAGRLKFRGRGYVEAPAVVTAVRPVAYGHETRWKIHFAYFDTKGHAQESIDEVNDPSWKVNDDCVAVYRPKTPDLATLQARPGQQPVASRQSPVASSQ
jgi:hypothetical protein